MVEIERLDAHERPPDVIRVRYKEYRNLKPAEIDSHPLIVDLQRLDSNGLPKGLCLDGYVSKQTLALAVNEFMNCDLQDEVEDIPIYSHQAVPGLRILPSILPHAVQTELLGRIFHRDLSNERHQTNIHLHYNIPYPAFQETPRDSSQTDGSVFAQKRGSFFEEDPSREVVPKDPSIHKPLSIQSFLDRKLRWMTLGGQYNWTYKRYPKETPPPFPEDIAKLLHTIFPDTNAEAAIVNLYSPNDTLSVHRDFSPVRTVEGLDIEQEDQSERQADETGLLKSCRLELTRVLILTMCDDELSRWLSRQSSSSFVGGIMLSFTISASPRIAPHFGLAS
ncbi:hypothetical protein FQN52_007875 [Onygenales sp. PD_12]|nr:hypothetical protein FQN52_007875 [Onygenales sp. PD_12]